MWGDGLGDGSIPGKDSDFWSPYLKLSGFLQTEFANLFMPLPEGPLLSLYKSWNIFHSKEKTISNKIRKDGKMYLSISECILNPAL